RAHPDLHDAPARRPFLPFPSPRRGGGPRRKEDLDCAKDVSQVARGDPLRRDRIVDRQEPPGPLRVARSPPREGGAQRRIRRLSPPGGGGGAARGPPPPRGEGGTEAPG